MLLHQAAAVVDPDQLIWRRSGGVDRCAVELRRQQQLASTCLDFASPLPPSQPAFAQGSPLRAGSDARLVEAALFGGEN